ncbi:MAG: PsiF family protein [Stagnimonas sp.]|nr:PsiF family protein [Stagnimonas sp.]
MSVKTFVVIAATAFTLLTSNAFAQDAPAKKAPTEKQLAQRAKMKSCNAEAKTQSLKGDDRKAFMKTCLSGGTPDAAGSTEPMPAPTSDQKAKMKACNAEAKEKTLKGDDRKAFMKTCLTAG